MAAFEHRISIADFSAFASLSNPAQHTQEIQDVVNSMVDDLGFLILAKVGQGLLVPLMKKEYDRVSHRNPVLANRMYEKNRAGVYAPLQVLIYEGNDSKTRATCCLPSTLLGQFKYDDITFVACMLDERSLD